MQLSSCTCHRQLCLRFHDHLHSQHEQVTHVQTMSSPAVVCSSPSCELLCTASQMSSVFELTACMSHPSGIESDSNRILSPCSSLIHSKALRQIPAKTKQDDAPLTQCPCLSPCCVLAARCRPSLRLLLLLAPCQWHRRCAAGQASSQSSALAATAAGLCPALIDV